LNRQPAYEENLNDDEEAVVRKTTKGVGSSGKSLGLGGIPIRSNVQIFLGANNSLRSRPMVKPESYPICVKEALCTDSKFA
jgi:hypothetical protein